MALYATSVFAQGLTTNATKDDWEEINFETGSAVLTDGFPSLLRLAELMAKNDGYRVKVEGHGDPNTPARIAEKLGMARANMVKQFLEKYGARPAQITVSTAGNKSPKVGNDTKEGRFMNRRVFINVTDPQGRNVSAAGVGDAIRNLNAATGGPAAMADPKCCDEILKRLDKLDDILALLRGMKGEHDALKKEVEGLKGSQVAAAAATSEAVKNLPNKDEVMAAAAKATDEAMTKMGNKKLSLLGLNAGADNQGRLTFAGKGRFFNPFNDSVALQSEGEYMYFRDRQEGQFDLGLVNRYKKAQMGLFSSFKHVNMREFQNGGTLGQGSVTFDYIFNRGRIGVFGTKGFLNNAVVGSSILSRNVVLENYLRIVDQVGGSGAVALWRDTYMEGNLGYLKTAFGAKPGMTLRFVQPLNSHIALSVEGGINETLVSRDNSGAVRFGLLFGGWLRPKNYGEVKGPVPVDIPRIRYELLSRRVRTGNDAPVADAGPDQINANSANVIQLDGSGSFDPEGDPITFEWRQIAGPAVTLNNPTTNRPSFTAVENQNYAFRLTVKDDRNAMGTARVTITTRAPQQVRILRYQANPQTIAPGQAANLLWLVENAETVTITNVGPVDSKQGTTQVRPTQTTTYRLTARNSTSEASEDVTVTVTQPQVRIITFNATPANITKGETSTLAWQTENAETVTITNLGNVQVNGSSPVTPEATTTYTITATNRGGTATATATVQVGTGPVTPGGGLPRIIRFTASPMDITVGQTSTVSWLVENADNVVISTLGTVGLTGQTPVAPNANTLYTITATNTVGSISSTVGINVRPAVVPPTPNPTITACVASPSTISAAGEAVSISYTAQNARVVTLNGLGIGNPVVVRPTATTTYTLIAYGATNEISATCQVTVTLPNNPTIKPIPNPGPNFDTIVRDLTISGLASTDPEGLALTYRWRVIEKTAVILDPNSATTRIQLGEQFGPYEFELTVTNSKGISNTAILVINYVSTRVR